MGALMVREKGVWLSLDAVLGLGTGPRRPCLECESGCGAWCGVGEMGKLCVILHIFGGWGWGAVDGHCEVVVGL